MGENHFHKVPGCDNFSFYDTGAVYRVVDDRTGEIVAEFFLHDQAVQYILCREYPAGTTYPTVKQLRVA